MSISAVRNRSRQKPILSEAYVVKSPASSTSLTSLFASPRCKPVLVAITAVHKHLST